MNKTLYNVLKAIALIWLPAAGTLVFTMGDIWGFSWTTQAVGTIMAVDAFLGVGLGLSTRSAKKSGKAYDGRLLFDNTDPLTDRYRIDLDSDLENLPQRKEVRLKVQAGSLPSINESRE